MLRTVSRVSLAPVLRCPYVFDLFRARCVPFRSFLGARGTFTRVFYLLVPRPCAFGLWARRLCVQSRPLWALVPREFSRASLAPCSPWHLCPLPLGWDALRSRPDLSGPRCPGHFQGRPWPLACPGFCASALWVRAPCVPSQPFWALAPQSFTRGSLTPCSSRPLCLRPLGSGALRSPPGRSVPWCPGHWQGRRWPLARLGLLTPSAFGFGRSASRPGLSRPRHSVHFPRAPLAPLVSLGLCAFGLWVRAPCVSVLASLASRPRAFARASLAPCRP